MKINIVEAVKNEGDVFTKSFKGELPQIEFLGEDYIFPEGINVEASYQFDGEGIVVSGSFSGKAKTLCARCLKEVLFPVNFEFTEYYKKKQEDGIYTYEGEVIDLVRMLQDNVIINLPVKVLCDEGCKGLCSSCGKNLNEGECGCKNEADESNPFYKLSKLYDNEEV